MANELQKLTVDGTTYTIEDANAVPKGRTVNSKALSNNITLTGEDINLDSYSTPTTGTTAIGTSDAIQTAIGKLDHQSQIDQTNILYTLNTGVKNLLNYEAWKKDTSIIGGTAVWENNGVTLTSTAANCYTDQNIPFDARINVNTGDKVVLSWNLERASESYNGYAYIFPNGDSASAISVTAPIGKLEYTVPSNVTYLTYRFSITTGSGSILKYKNIMVSYKSVHDVSPTYDGYALPNSSLTALSIYNNANGVRNIWDFVNAEPVHSNNCTYTKTGGTLAITDNASTSPYVAFTLPLKAGSYVLQCKVTATTGSSAKKIIVKKDTYTGTTLNVIDITGTGLASVSFDNDADRTVAISFYTRTADSGVVESLTVTDVMLCDASIHNIVGDSYQPYALPNSDLTQEVNALHDRTDQIQDIARFRPAQAGWYRAFEMKNIATSTATGASDNSCSIVIKRDFANNNNEHHEIKLIAIYASDSVFTDEFSRSKNYLITAIRQVVTDNNAYIDIYYAGTNGNDIACAVTNNFDVVDGQARWRAVKSLSPVPEVTTGETVIALHNFSANDYKKAPGLNSVVMESGSLSDLSTSFIVCTANVTDKPLDAWGFVRTTVFGSNTALQEFFAFSSENQSDNGVSFVRVKQGGTWKSWKQITNA